MDDADSHRPVRGRGRGRGSNAPPSAIDVDLQDRGAGRPSTSRFKPRMIKRAAQSDSTNDDQLTDQRGRGRGSRGRGGAGRGGHDIVMSASGAFAMGPSAAPGTCTSKSSAPSSHVIGKSGMKRIDTTTASSRGTAIGVSITDDGDDDNIEAVSSIGSMSDDDDSLQKRRTAVLDLNDISSEHPMAPITLPFDLKRIATKETAKLKKQRKTVIDEIEEMVKVEQVNDCIDPTLQSFDKEIKKPTKWEEENDQLTQFGHQLFQNLHVTQPATDLHIFQFPRHFPLFQLPQPISEPTLQNDVKLEPLKLPASSSLLPKGATRVKKVKQWDDWSGWGKGGKRPTDQVGLGVPTTSSSVQGQIGKVNVRQSGKVEFVIGDMIYDVLPAAQATFHQEIVAIDPKSNTSNSNSNSLDRALYVLGKPSGKWIIAPKVNHLLKSEKNKKKTK